MNSSSRRCPYADLFAKTFVETPHEALQEARKDGAAHYLADLNLWLVPRYSDVRNILRQPEQFTNANVQKPLFPFSPQAIQYLEERGFNPGPALTGSDGDLHRRLRTKVARALEFSPRNLTSMSDAISEIATEIISALPAASNEPFDIVASAISKFPPRVVFRLIGFPASDHEQLQTWCMDRLRMFWGHSTSDEQLQIASGLAAYWSYCERFVHESMGCSDADNITTRLIALHREAPEELSEKEIAGILFGLVFAGQETTVNALASMLMLLLTKREHWERLLEDRTLLEKAFNETLRLEPPIAAWRRYVVEPTHIAEHEIPAGANLLLHLGSTGHDREKFGPDADEFSLDRENSEQHMAFGLGRHFCLGAPLAKLEANIFLDTLLNHEPELFLAPDQDYSYVPNVAFRGPQKLLVSRR